MGHTDLNILCKGKIASIMFFRTVIFGIFIIHITYELIMFEAIR